MKARRAPRARPAARAVTAARVDAAERTVADLAHAVAKLERDMMEAKAELERWRALQALAREDG